MAYGIRIELADGAPMRLEDWVNALEETPDVRMTDGKALTVENPDTGEQISKPYVLGDAEIFEHRSQSWLPYFGWREGRISMQVTRDFDDPNSQQRRVVRALAARLNAVVVGDEGETYD